MKDYATSLQLSIPRLAAEAQDLPPAERSAAEVLLARFSVLDRETTASIAAAAGVNAATVVRASRKLGFQGFEDLRLVAARASGPPASARPADVENSPSAESQDVIDIRSSMLIDAAHITAVASSLDARALVAIADALVAAEVVLCVAVGSSSSILGFAALRLLALGVQVSWYTDPQAQLAAAGVLSAEAQVLVLSQSGRTPDVLAAARKAKDRGAGLSLITAANRSPLASLADQTVVIGSRTPSGVGQILSRSVDVAVLNAVEALVYKRTQRLSHLEPG